MFTQEKILSQGSQFQNRLKYLMRRRRQQNDHEDAANESEDDQTEPSAEDDLIFLKEALIDQTDLHILKRKLNNTRELRLMKMKDLKFDIRESLPFFLSHPKLVC